MRIVAALSILALAFSALLGGGAPIGRIFLALGLPKIAVPFFGDPAWRGVALYRANAYAAAGTAFRDAQAFYNLGNAEVLSGSYAAALEAFDLASGNADARTNFDLVGCILWRHGHRAWRTRPHRKAKGWPERRKLRRAGKCAGRWHGR